MGLSQVPFRSQSARYRALYGVNPVRPVRGEAKRETRHRASLASTTDGLIWPTGGCLFRPAGLRYDPLVANQTAAWPVPVDLKNRSRRLYIDRMYSKSF